MSNGQPESFHMLQVKEMISTVPQRPHESRKVLNKVATSCIQQATGQQSTKMINCGYFGFYPFLPTIHRVAIAFEIVMSKLVCNIALINSLDQRNFSFFLL